MYRLVVGIATLNTVFANLVNNSTAASGKNFLLVGDFAYILNMTPAYETFDAMNKLVADENIDHFVTMGDNVYPIVPQKPTDDEFKQMKDLFKRDNMKDLPVTAIRGNHDCYYDKKTWLQIFKNDTQWDVPYYYFAREI